MKILRYLVVGAVLLLFLQLAVASQKSKTLNEVLLTDVRISRFEWLSLMARVGVLEDSAGLPPTYTYDAAKDRLVATATVPPTWLDSMQPQDAKDKIESQAISYCKSFFLADPALAKWSALDTLNHCYVRFLSWNRELDWKTLAEYENGEVSIK